MTKLKNIPVKMTVPKVSVVMPVFNDERHLKEAIDSILQQTFTNFEFIIINDGSTDKTNDILDTYTDSRLKVIKNDSNLGISKSLNIGIKQAEGEYIARMDSDDIAFAERLSRQISFLEGHTDIAVVGSACSWINEQGDTVSINLVFTEDKQIKRWMSLGAGEAYIWHPTILIRKKSLLEVGLYTEDLVTTQDKDLWMKLASHGYKLANISDILLKKRISVDSKMQIRSKQRKYINSLNKDVLSLLRAQFEDLEIPPIQKHTLKKFGRRACAILYTRLGRELQLDNQNHLARRAFINAIKCYPFDKKLYQYYVKGGSGWRSLC